jgi:membrane fusion protein, multidrug efflux system
MYRIARMLSLPVLIVAISSCRQNSAPADAAAAPDAEPVVSVTTAPVVLTTLHGYVTGWGRVEPEAATAGRPPANASIAAPVAGIVATIQCTEGQRVRKGDTLFQLDSRVADVGVRRAQEAVQYAESVVQRQEQLGPGQATSQKAYQDAKQQLAAAQSELNAVQVQRRLLDVPAPIDGTIVRINTKLGNAIDPMTVLAEMIDLNRLVVTAAIRSVDARQVRRGQRVTLSAGAAPGAPSDAVQAPASSPSASAPTETATVEYLGALVDPATDTVMVRARLPVTSTLRPGQYVKARVLTDERPNQLAVPVESIVQGAGGPEVALVQGDMAVRTPVRTGLTEGGLIQVEGNGVREGTSVVVQGAYGLLPKTRIRVIGR